MVSRKRLAGDLAVELRELVTTELAPGMRMQSEKELGERFGVSRNTVREALLVLWEEGLVIRKWGVGTFVREAEQPWAQNMSKVVPVDDLVRSAGQELSLSATEVDTVIAPSEVSTALGLEAGAEVWCVNRTFAFDGRPAFALIDWFPLVVNGREIDPSPLRDISSGLLRLLKDAARTRVVSMEAQLTAVLADSALAAQLQVEVGFPVVAAEQVSVDSSGEIVIFSRNYYRTDVASLHIVRSAERA